MHSGHSARSKDFLTLREFNAEQLARVLSLTEEVKRDRLKFKDALAGKSIAMFFQKPSMRTRVSFQVGIAELGGTTIYMGPHDDPLGHREPIADVARVTARYCAATVIRANRHEDVALYANAADHPVINALCDRYHPCQTLADLFTMREKFDTLQGRTIAWIGDGNNVFNSLAIGAATLGCNVVAAIPEGYTPTQLFVDSVTPLFKATGATLTITHDAKLAAKKADAIYTDVWTSMGQETERERRHKEFSHYQLNKSLARELSKDAIILHCLPAHRGEEITDDVIEDPRSRIFDQAENRLHTQKALLLVMTQKA